MDIVGRLINFQRYVKRFFFKFQNNRGFIITGLHGEKFIKSPIKVDPHHTAVKFISVSWKPNKGDIGNHLACVRAVDNTG